MSEFPRILKMNQPRTLAFGAGCANECANDIADRGFKSALIVTSPPTRGLCEPIATALRAQVANVAICDAIAAEPTIADFRAALSAARDVNADAIFGIGGGSPMDVAKLVAAFLGNAQDINDAFGIGKLSSRATYLACLPTTAGTGSEVSPNAILLDESQNLKKGVISPHLMPDAAYVDPALTLTVPRAVTAATGIDALTHCIEAYANKLAHPVIDLLTLEGIRRINLHLKRACDAGDDLEARTNVALGSMYGGIALGPVNTGAVHALSYPLGGEFHVPHGVANAVLLTAVLEFNLPASPSRYADIAIALGCDRDGDDDTVARRGLERLRELCAECGIPKSMSELGVPQSAIERMADGAMTVTRLLDRNVRTVTRADAIEIYRRAF